MKLYKEALSLRAEKIENPELSLEDRQILSQQLVDFADRHCNPSEATAFEEKHASTFSTYKMEAASRKRTAEASTDEPTAKKPALNGLHETVAQKALPQANPAVYTPASSAAPAGDSESTFGFCKLKF